MSKEKKEREEFIKYVCGGCETELNRDEWEGCVYCPHCGTELVR